MFFNQGAANFSKVRIDYKGSAKFFNGILGSANTKRLKNTAVVGPNQNKRTRAVTYFINFNE